MQRSDGHKPPPSKIETSKVNGRDKYHSDLYRLYLENEIISKKQ